MFWRRRKIFVYVDNEFWETLTHQNVTGFLVDQIGVNVEIRNLLCDITPYTLEYLCDKFMIFSHC